MRRIILVGPIGCGKSTLCQTLNEMEIKYKKTQAIELIHDTIDTPGEYLENRRYNSALMITAVQAEMVLLMQACGDERAIFSQGFASMFGGKTVWGIVGKIDLARSEEQVERIEKHLVYARVERVFRVSCSDTLSIECLREALA